MALTLRQAKQVEKDLHTAEKVLLNCAETHSGDVGSGSTAISTDSISDSAADSGRGGSVGSGSSSFESAGCGNPSCGNGKNSVCNNNLLEEIESNEQLMSVGSNNKDDEILYGIWQTRAWVRPGIDPVTGALPRNAR